MIEYVAESVPAASLQNLLESGKWSWLYAERMETTELLWLADALQADVSWMRWQYARAFAAESELTWQRGANGRYQLRLLQNQEPPALDGLTWQKVAEWRRGSQIETILHGTLDNGDAQTLSWSEARIPRRLHYPLPADAGAPERVVLVTENLHYDSEDTLPVEGGAVLTRLVAVQELAEEA